MKYIAILASVLTAALSGFAQTKPACQGYFQVVQMDRRIPGGIITGMSVQQKKWWEKKGQKKYPELCWNGQIASADKPRYLLIWSSEAPAGPVRIPKDAEQPTGADTYGKTASAIKDAAAANTHPLLKRTILLVNVSSPGEPPIELTKDWWFFHSYSQKVLDEALSFLLAAPPYPPSGPDRSFQSSHGAS